MDFVKIEKLTSPPDIVDAAWDLVQIIKWRLGDAFKISPDDPLAAQKKEK